MDGTEEKTMETAAEKTVTGDAEMTAGSSSEAKSAEGRSDALAQLEKRMLAELRKRGLSPEVKNVQYPNGEKRCIVTEKLILDKGKRLSVTLPVERLAVCIGKGSRVEDIADDFRDATRKDPTIGMNIKPDRQTLLNNVRPVLMDGDLPKDCIAREWNDFHVVLKSIVYGFETSVLMFVTSEHLRYTGLTEDELFEAAYRNIESSICIADIAEVVNTLPGICEKNTGLSILSCDNEIFKDGASAVLSSAALKKLSRRYGGDFFLLPASKHEFIAVPIAYDANPMRWKRLVQEVNSTFPADEVLGESVYRYNAEDGTVRLVA